MGMGENMPTPYEIIDAAQMGGRYADIRSIIAYARAALRNDGEEEVDEEVEEIEAACSPCY
jgi:hypothetical protein